MIHMVVKYNLSAIYNFMDFLCVVNPNKYYIEYCHATKYALYRISPGQRHGLNACFNYDGIHTTSDLTKSGISTMTESTPTSDLTKSGEGLQQNDVEDNEVEDLRVAEDENSQGEADEDMVCDTDEFEMERIQICEGMEFGISEELYHLFLDYGRQVGFPVRRMSSTKKDGVLTYIRFACAREGMKSSTTAKFGKPRPLCGIGCKVQVAAKLIESNRWVVISTMLEHNHDCSPSKSRLFRCYRSLTQKDKREIAFRDQAGTSLEQVLKKLGDMKKFHLLHKILEIL